MSKYKALEGVMLTSWMHKPLCPNGIEGHKFRDVEDPNVPGNPMMICSDCDEPVKWSTEPGIVFAPYEAGYLKGHEFVYGPTAGVGQPLPEGLYLKYQKIRATNRELKEKYYADHAVCPKCGGGTDTTLAGYIMDPNKPENFKDENTCRCRCGWVGTAHEKVPKKTP